MTSQVSDRLKLIVKRVDNARKSAKQEKNRETSVLPLYRLSAVRTLLKWLDSLKVQVA